MSSRTPVGGFKILVDVNILCHNIRSDEVVHTDLCHRPITVELIVISDIVTSQKGGQATPKSSSNPSNSCAFYGPELNLGNCAFVNTIYCYLIKLLLDTLGLTPLTALRNSYILNFVVL